MNHTVPTQHPAVVLRSHYLHLRMMLAVAMFAVIGLSVAVVIVASDENTLTRPATATPAVTAIPAPTPGVRYDGGPDEGTRGAITSTPASSAGLRYDGGPNEGTRGITNQSQSQSAPQRLGASRPEPAFR